MTHPLEKILFIDIETVPLCKAPEEMPEALREIYGEKKKKRKVKAKPKKGEDSEVAEEDAPAEDSFGGTGLEAEFGRVLGVALGRYEGGLAEENFKVKSIFSANEIEVLEPLSKVFSKYSDFKLCAHNGKNFDYPFLGKRYLINGLPLPEMLNLSGLKPWNVPHLDTSEMWQFGAKPQSISLKLLCAVFGIPSPKDDISGADVAPAFYNRNEIDRISEYCKKDVVATAKVYKRLVGLSL